MAQNRNTTDAADPIAGSSAGRTTDRNARGRDAPSARAASSARRSVCAHSPPTVRATTATLKNALASTIGSTPPSGHSARKARPTTTVGSTNGTITAARTNPVPTTSQRASRNATGSPASRASTVDAAAWPRVNPTSSHVPAAASTPPTPPSRTPSRTIASTGQAKKTPRKASGTNAANAHPVPRSLSPLRARATAAPTARGWR